MNKRSKRLSILGSALSAALLGGYTTPASACGGFFCSQSQPVNQAAERIVFAQNANGTVTAVIQILYEGPSENFSWLLPISSVPDAEGEIAVASNLAFQRLQAATNPQYILNNAVEGTCRSDEFFSGNAPGSPSGAAGSGSVGFPDSDPSDNGVTVAASGVVGAFDWTALELNASLEDPAGAALEWLTDNGYDVLPQSAELIGPYLESGMYLLALRLTKGATTGSIRPIVLTYDGDLPSIPIKLTAVAANDNMGVMTWMLSDSRAVPFNYNALELNEARINWFNAASNYESVVTAAANDSGGQGFVTEFAGASDSLAGVVWPPFEELDWQTVKTGVYASFGEVFNATYYRYGQFDGFWDSVQQNVTLPANVGFADFQSCPNCYSEQLTFSPSAYLAAIEADVIQPVRLVQQLIDAHPYATRLYSTLSAADMTVDPVFTYNAGLPGVDNVHTATRTIECSPDLYQFEAPWRINLPQGGVIRGTPDQVGSWPTQVADQPANFRVLTLSESGPGVVLKDNATQINQMLASYNDSLPATVGSPPDPMNPLSPTMMGNPTTPDTPMRPSPSTAPPMMGGGDSGCGMAGANAGTAASTSARGVGSGLLLLALGLMRRQRRAPGRRAET